MFLFQLEDWNNRRQFTLPTDFHYHEAMNENFVSQVCTFVYLIYNLDLIFLVILFLGQGCGVIVKPFPFLRAYLLGRDDYYS